MSQSALPEVWLRGPIPHVPPLVQPVAHALLQAAEEVNQLVTGFSADLLWIRPHGLASAGFHLQHLCGVVDRLFTYAEGSALSAEQLNFLQMEGTEPHPDTTATELANDFQLAVDRAIHQLTLTKEETLKEERFVGRSRIASTQIGLLMHAAEHSMRHIGQLLVTIRMLKGNG